MRLIDGEALHALIMAEATQMDDPLAKMFTCAAASEVRHAPTVSAIPVQFITDKINSLEYLQKKMSAWTTPELEIQIQTLVHLIQDYAQIAGGKE